MALAAFGISLKLAQESASTTYGLPEDPDNTVNWEEKYGVGKPVVSRANPCGSSKVYVPPWLKAPGLLICKFRPEKIKSSAAIVWLNPVCVRSINMDDSSATVTTSLKRMNTEVSADTALLPVALPGNISLTMGLATSSMVVNRVSDAGRWLPATSWSVPAGMPTTCSWFASSITVTRTATLAPSVMSTLMGLACPRWPVESISATKMASPDTPGMTSSTASVKNRRMEMDRETPISPSAGSAYTIAGASRSALLA
mmetsp:Transcript_16275/g.41577  ORF Transcript_16275/g.41577 Transcript_16275/m.41577 type:complete len:256 (-) Transcript_16275:30-797(-)